MSTPQRKVWLGWLSPGSEKNGSVSANLDPNSSPRDRMMDQELLLDKISKLEKELYEYQYNLGLLLIEKKESNSKNEQFEQELLETKELLKREQTMRIIAVSEVENREEKLRNALGVEKQCVHELEKALHEMRTENAKIKVTAESKLEEANVLSSSAEEKLLEVEAKVHAADAKLAEVNRKTSEIQRKSVEFEAKERVILRERIAFNAEREAHERNLLHQREDLREWEKKLQEGEERLAEVRRLVNQREERANENDKIFKQKQIEFEEKKNKFDLAFSALKTKEDNMNDRIGNLTLKEKEADAMRNYLETKKKELLELEEKLKTRKQVEIQKLLDEHKIILDAKKRDFELEMEQKRKSLDDSFKNKVVEVEKKEVEVNHLEGILTKREQALEKKLNKFKEKEKEFDSKSKALKEHEKSLNVDQKNIEIEKKEIFTQKENLLTLDAELQNLKTDIEGQKLNVIKERKKLQVTEEERSEHTRLQSELKQEIETSRHERDALLKERDDLKHERARFERDWEDLDEKRTDIEKESEALVELKKRVEKWNLLETEKLHNERLETQVYVEKELEALKLAKDSFAANMEHEKSVLDKKYQSESSKMLREFEVFKQKLETQLQNRETEIENKLCEREKLLEEERDRERTDIIHSRDVASREIEETKLERLKLEKEKQEILANRNHLEAQQLEMKKDIDDLVGLIMKLKDQRQQFVKERDRFAAFVEKQKGCKDCGQRVSEFVFSDLKSLDVNNTETFNIPRIANGYVKNKKVVSGTPERPNGDTSKGSPAMSWLRKCTSKIFIFSAGKKNELEAAQEKLVEVGEIPEYILSSEDEPEGTARVVLDSFDVPAQSGLDPLVKDVSNINGQAREVEEVSEQAIVNEGQSKPTRGRTRTRVKKAIVGGAIETNGSVHANGDSEHTTSRIGRKRNRKDTSEEEHEYSENSGSVTRGGGRNTRRKAAPVVEAPQQKRYNLRRPKIAAPVASNGALSNQSKNDEVDGVGINKGEPDSNVEPRPSTSLANGNLAGASKADEFLLNKVAKDTVPSDKMNGSRSNDDEEIGSPVAEKKEEVDDSEDEAEHPGEISIGRKLWTFIST